MEGGAIQIAALEDLVEHAFVNVVDDFSNVLQNRTQHEDIAILLGVFGENSRHQTVENSNHLTMRRIPPNVYLFFSASLQGLNERGVGLVEEVIDHKTNIFILLVAQLHDGDVGVLVS